MYRQFFWVGTFLTMFTLSPAFGQDGGRGEGHTNRLDRMGDRIDHRLDRSGDRIDNRLDHRGDRMDRRLDRRGDRIDRRMDHKGDRADRRLDRKGDRIDHRLDRKAERARQAGHDGLADRLDRKGDRIDRPFAPPVYLKFSCQPIRKLCVSRDKGVVAKRLQTTIWRA